MFLGMLNTILFNFSNNPFHFELKIRSIQIVVITSSVVISNVGIKRVDRNMKVNLISTSLVNLRPKGKLIYTK